MITKTWSEVSPGAQILTTRGDVWWIDTVAAPHDLTIRSVTTGKTKNVAAQVKPAGRVQVLEQADHQFVARPNVLAFDCETAGAEDMFRRPDFFRLGQAGQLVTTDGAALVQHLMAGVRAGKTLVGHNICAFDLPVLAYHHGLDLLALKGSIIDTDLLARIEDPPPSGRDGVSKYPAGYYGLDQTAARYGAPAKTDDVKALAKKHGGFDKIPTDDQEFLAYLAGDIASSAGLIAAMPPLTSYGRREMVVGLITAQMMVNGFRVDVPELARALAEQAIRKESALAELHHLAGVPLGTKSPLASDAGKTALSSALVSHGIRSDRLPTTPKTGKLSTGREDMSAILAAVQRRGGMPELERILTLVMQVVGERTVYKTIDDCRIGDRVHPTVRPTQASGRWSVTRPGLTVLGKRGGRHVERRVLIPDEGHSIIAVDLDQVDARAVAAHSGDPDYMRIFQDGLDVHGEVAQEIFGDRTMRETVKAIVHGWNYGRGARAITEATGLPLDVTEHFDREMRRKYPKLVEWQNRVRDVAGAGTLLDNGFGRRLRADPAFAYTQAPALIGQAATRDILAEGMLRLPVELWPYLRTVVHDELVLSVPSEDAVEIGREVVKAMSFDFLGVPITSGCSKPGVSWAAVYTK